MEKKVSQKSSISYEEGIRELNAIIAELDSGNVSVDVLADRFKRAVEIVQELSKKIAEAKLQIEQLTPKLEAILSKESSDEGLSVFTLNDEQISGSSDLEQDLFEEDEYGEEPF